MKEYLVPYCDELKQEVKSRFCYICPRCGNMDRRKLHIQTKRFISTINKVYNQRNLSLNNYYYTWKKHRIICLQCWHVWKSPAYPLLITSKSDLRRIERYIFGVNKLSFISRIVRKKE